MIVYQQNNLTIDAAKLIGDIALLSGHIGGPRNGILMIKPKNNSQGLVDLGIHAGKEALAGVKALFVFGENADIDTDALEFLAVCDTHMTELAAKATLCFREQDSRAQTVPIPIPKEDCSLLPQPSTRIFSCPTGRSPRRSQKSSKKYSDGKPNRISPTKMRDTVPAYKYAEL